MRLIDAMASMDAPMATVKKKPKARRPGVCSDQLLKRSAVHGWLEPPVVHLNPSMYIVVGGRRLLHIPDEDG